MAFTLLGQEVILPTIDTEGRSGMSSITVVDSSSSVTDTTIITNMNDGGVLGSGKLWTSPINKKSKSITVTT